MGFDPNLFPASELYYQTAISIPIYPDLTDEEQIFVAETTQSSRGYQTLF